MTNAERYLGLQRESSRVRSYMDELCQIRDDLRVQYEALAKLWWRLSSESFALEDEAGSIFASMTYEEKAEVNRMLEAGDDKCPNSV